MFLTTRNALARARSMIEVIRLSTAHGLVDRNKAVAEGYILSLLDCGLIERVHFDQLTNEAEEAVSSWSAKPGLATLATD